MLNIHTPPRFRIGVSFPVLILMLLAMLLWPATPVQAKSASYAELNVDLTVQQDGSFRIEETQIVAFTGGSFSKGYRSIPLVRTGGITDIAVFELVDGTRVAYSQTRNATSPGTFSTSSTATDVTINWVYSDQTDGSRTFILAYTVLDALRSYPDASPPVQQVWFTPVAGDLTRETAVSSSRFTIHLPTAATSGSLVLAVDGKQITPPEAVTTDYQQFTFTHGAFDPGTGWEIHLQTSVIAPDAPVPAWQARDDAQRQRQTQQETRDTQIASLAVIVAIAIVIVGTLSIFLLWYTTGKDPATGIVASFLPEPPDATPPAVVGVLIDERADEHDIASTIVDLGNRGLLAIHETPGTDTTIELRSGAESLSGFEQQFVQTLFPSGTTVISYASARRAIDTSQTALKQSLYQEVVTRGYFARSPEQTRQRWHAIAMTMTTLGVLAGVFGGMLVSGWMVAPAMALVLVSIVLRLVSRVLPRRTRDGAEAAATWQAFRRYLADLEKYDKLDTAKANFHRFLPYAIAFGLEKEWITRFRQSGSTPPAWLNPGGFGDVLSTFPDGPFRGPGHRPIIVTGDIPRPSSHPGGGIDLPDMPDLHLPDLQKTSDRAARGLGDASKGSVDLLNILGGIIQIASIFIGSGDKGGSSGGGKGGFS